MEAWFASLMNALALPKFGLSTVFVIALISATLLPLGSEPAVFGLVKLNPSMFWPAVFVATAGNTIGGAMTWWMGYGAERAYEHMTPQDARSAARCAGCERFGPKACLLSWLPVVGDPLCAWPAGWSMPFWPCVVYMAIGKFARYLTMTAALLWCVPGDLHAVNETRRRSAPLMVHSVRLRRPCAALAWSRRGLAGCLRRRLRLLAS